MKTILWLIIAFITISVGTACNAVLSNENETVPQYTSDTANMGTIPNDEILLVSDKHFRIFGNADTGNYYYEIINSNGELVYSNTYFGAITPEIQYISDNIIEICLYGGNYAESCKFYSIAQDKFSDNFINPYLVENGKIVYYDGNTHQLIVQDIFSKNKFYKVFSRDIAVTAAPLEIKFIDDDTKLFITYYRESDFIEITETINLE